MTEDILKHRHENAVRSPPLFVQILVPIFTGILGAFTDDILQGLFPGPFKPEKLPLTSAVISIVVFIIAIAIGSALHKDAITKTSSDHEDLNEKLVAIGKNVSRISEAVGPLARVLSYQAASALLMEKIEAAESEVLVLSNYDRFDWTAGEPKKVSPVRSTDNSKRSSNYERTQKKLSQMRGRPSFKFAKIIQIPKGCRLEDALPHDPLYANDCQFIIDSGISAPERISLRVSETIFQNTFVIVDGSFLYLEFDMGNHVDGLSGEPFLIVVEDPGSKFVTTLRDLFRHIEAVSPLQKTLIVTVPARKAATTGQPI
jgi:hypothetical protein